MTQFASIPATIKVIPDTFQVCYPEKELSAMRALISSSPVGSATFESSQEDRKYGITTEWLRSAKNQWLQFDWRKVEKRINSFPNFITRLDVSGSPFGIHFVGLFSNRKDAIPVMMLHGWPGSFLEFLPLLDILRSRYSPETLPYHVIVPSLPGYGFSSKPPVDRDFRLEDAAQILDNVMIQLGFHDGYVISGGDVGSKIARVLGATSATVKAVHLNFSIMPDPGNIEDTQYSDLEKQGLKRAAWFSKLGSAYALEHATKPSTIGLVVSSSPLAMLAWIGEKFLDWTGIDPPLESILESVTLYWLSGCFPTSLWPYRQLFTPGNIGAHENPEWYIYKPLGMSWFPKEIAPVPRAWTATTGNLVFFRQHEHGGHFAALEHPHVLLEDLENFISQIWNPK